MRHSDGGARVSAILRSAERRHWDTLLVETFVAICGAKLCADAMMVPS
ncbi:MAG: hypothetical protein JOY96_11120 [Verrucomicrobia bacterium]|nr:hypothetical protein [Verrucomicrobiota bacterium]